MSRGLSRDSVLVIDDDPDLRNLIDAIAEVCGLRTLQAADCIDGLKILDAERQRIKLIFLDYFMPGMEPAKCAAALVARAGPAIPIVLLTAAADPAACAAELNISSWIAKPFEVSTMAGLLTQTSLPRTG